MAGGYVNQFTLQYKTFVKRAAVEAMSLAFFGDGAELPAHMDPTVRESKVAIDFTGNDFKLPAVIVKFNEETMPNAGVGHFEWLPDPIDGTPGVDGCVLIQYMHRLYKGSIEFDIYGMSSVDRDIIADAVVETLTMDEVSTSGKNFLTRFYDAVATAPYGQWHFATLNIDLVQPSGEDLKIAPWNPEDQLVYNTSYKVPIFGEFYSYTPPEPFAPGVIEEVDVYPYISGTDPSPAQAPPSAFYKFKGNIPGEVPVPDGSIDEEEAVIPGPVSVGNSLPLLLGRTPPLP
jgi:hypothetical protein